jgi:transcriptional regulator with XRE-family HTH domain
MPSRPPPLGPILEERLRDLGKSLRAHRERQKLSATVTAEAAGISRVTLHRIERGEASVTMGAYLSAIDAVGLSLQLEDPHQISPLPGASHLPERIRLAAYPQLQRLAWQVPGVEELTPAEALSLYERNWRHLDPERMSPDERALVRALTQQWGGGRLLV